MSICVPCKYISEEVRRRALDTLELELSMVVSCCVLIIEQPVL